LRRLIAPRADGAGVLVLDLAPARFKLLHACIHAPIRRSTCLAVMRSRASAKIVNFVTIFVPWRIGLATGN
jgi:hypothetical protein